MLDKLREFRTLRANRKLSTEELAALRLRKLKTVLHHAGKQVPFYQTLWKEAGITPDDLRCLEDLSGWPIVTKQQLKQAGDLTLAGGQALSDSVTVRTSGSTGDVFEVKLTRAEHRTRLLIEFRTLLAMGFGPRDRLTVLGPAHGRGAHLHERLGLFRTEILTMDLTVDEQIAELRRLQPTILWAYPGCLRSILDRVNYRLSQVIRPRLVITSSEVMPESLRERLQEDLGCELFNSYACMETGRLAAECRAHRGLHVNADHVIVECVQEDWLEGQDHGAVVVTTLNALQKPLIRYRLGDLTHAVEGPCDCGCSFPMIVAPVGREDDLMVLPSGRLLAAWYLGVALQNYRELDQFRFVQHERDRLELQVVVQGEWTEERQSELRRDLLHRIGEPVGIEIRIVDFMETAGAKFSKFFSHVPIPETSLPATSGHRSGKTV